MGAGLIVDEEYDGEHGVTERCLKAAKLDKDTVKKALSACRGETANIVEVYINLASYAPVAMNDHRPEREERKRAERAAAEERERNKIWLIA